MIYRRSHIKTGRRSVDAEHAGPTPTCDVWKLERISQIWMCTLGSPAQGSNARKRSYHNFSSVETSADYSWVRRKAAGVLGVPLKWPAYKLTWTHSELHHCSSSSKSTRDTQRGAELSGFGLKAEVLQKTLFLCWAFPFQVQVGAISESPSTWFTTFSLPWWLPDT